jgi:hypothetical protein
MGLESEDGPKKKKKGFRKALKRFTSSLLVASIAPHAPWLAGQAKMLLLKGKTLLLTLGVVSGGQNEPGITQDITNEVAPPGPFAPTFGISSTNSTSTNTIVSSPEVDTLLITNISVPHVSVSVSQKSSGSLPAASMNSLLIKVTVSSARDLSIQPPTIEIEQGSNPQDPTPTATAPIPGRTDPAPTPPSPLIDRIAPKTLYSSDDVVSLASPDKALWQVQDSAAGISLRILSISSKGTVRAIITNPSFCHRVIAYPGYTLAFTNAERAFTLSLPAESQALRDRVVWHVQETASGQDASVLAVSP